MNGNIIELASEKEKRLFDYDLASQLVKETNSNTGEVIAQSIDGKEVFYDRDKNGKLVSLRTKDETYYYKFKPI